MESLRKLAKHCAVIVFLWLFCLPEISEAEALYRVTVLAGNQPPYQFGASAKKINNAGQVVGAFSLGSGISRAFLWSTSTGIQNLGVLSGDISSTSSDINDAGKVIGISFSGAVKRAFLWTTTGGMQNLGTLLNRDYSYAVSINNAGQVVGYSGNTSSYTGFVNHAFLWSPSGGMLDLGLLVSNPSLSNIYSSASAINDKGQVVGKTYNKRTDGTSGNTNFLWDSVSGTKTDFISQGYPYGFNIEDINNAGQIIGGTPAFIWSSAIGLRYLFPGDVASFVHDINNLGYVVGEYDTGDRWAAVNLTGFIWNANDGIQDLNDLIDPADPLKPYLTIGSANGINDNGQVVGIAFISGYNQFCPYYWYCEVAVLLTPSPSLTIDLLDPVPSLLEGSAVSTNPDSLAKKGRLVEGVGADGVATLVLRIHAKSAGESITLTLDGPSTDEAGALGVLGATPDALTTTVTAESTTEGPMAFALYRAPVDFAWNESHHNLQRRSVTLSASSSSGGSATKSIDVIRPPVVLVHGLWGSPSDWADFDLYKNPAFTRFTIDYESTNSEAFTLNARNLAIEIFHGLEAFAKRKKIAIAQADFVAHSMGGDITRSMPSKINYSKRNFNKGYVHKLITIGTPHLGSPLARELIKPENAKIAVVFNQLGMAIKAEGAVGDLKGDGDGNGLSDALKKLQNVPMAMLAGRISPTQISEVKMSVFTSILGFAVTFDSPPPPLLSKFTPENYNSLMGGYHDGIVPLTSAINQKEGESWGDGLKEEGGLHSNGTRYL